MILEIEVKLLLCSQALLLLLIVSFHIYSHKTHIRYRFINFRTQKVARKIIG